MMRNAFLSPIGSTLDIARVVQDKTAESIVLEFKRSLPGSSDAERKEFLKDISALLNTLGGSVLYGIEEREQSAQAIFSLGSVNYEKESDRLVKMALTGLEPPASILCFLHEVPDQGVVLEVRCSPSRDAPHMVKLNHDKFWARNDTGRYQMGVVELRNRFNSINPAKTTFCEEYVKLYEIFTGNVTGLVDKRFERCIIDGPALCAIVGRGHLKGCKFTYCEAIIVKPGTKVRNIIYIESPNMIDCDLRNLTLFMNAEEYLTMPKNLQQGIQVIAGHQELSEAQGQKR